MVGVSRKGQGMAQSPARAAMAFDRSDVASVMESIALRIAVLVASEPRERAAFWTLSPVAINALRAVILAAVAALPSLFASADLRALRPDSRASVNAASACVMLSDSADRALSASKDRREEVNVVRESLRVVAAEDAAEDARVMRVTSCHDEQDVFADIAAFAFAVAFVTADMAADPPADSLNPEVAETFSSAVTRPGIFSAREICVVRASTDSFQEDTALSQAEDSLR